MRTLLLVVVVAAGSQLASGQTIRRVNNNFGVTGVNVYTTPQAAHDAATANDILIIEPSLVSYGDLILTKPLKIYGNGYYLTINTELRVDQRNSNFNGTITFNTGSSGSYIAGVVVSTINIRSASDITITRCAISSVDIRNHNVANTATTNVSNILIARNLFAVGIGVTVTATYTISNVTVTNNILQEISAAGNEVQGWIVKNNTFRVIGCCGVRPVNLYNSVFDNNLMTDPSGGNSYSVSFTNTPASYNISYTTHFAEVNGNQNDFGIASEFVSSAGLSSDATYQLKDESVLKSAGVDGIEVGAFGGPTPYVISGTASIPTISKMISTSGGSNSSPLHVTLSVKSNN